MRKRIPCIVTLDSGGGGIMKTQLIYLLWNATYASEKMRYNWNSSGSLPLPPSLPLFLLLFLSYNRDGVLQYRISRIEDVLEVVWGVVSHSSYKRFEVRPIHKSFIWISKTWEHSSTVGKSLQVDSSCSALNMIIENAVICVYLSLRNDSQMIFGSRVSHQSYPGGYARWE